MSIEKFYTTAFTVYRHKWADDNDGFSYSETDEIDEGFNGHIQQISPKLAQYLNLNFTKTFSVWCGLTTDVKIGDILHDGSNYFTVKEIQTNDIGANSHLELVVELSEEFGS